MGDSPRSTSSGNMRRVKKFNSFRNFSTTKIIRFFIKIGESGRSTVELEKIIALMKKRVDNLQMENQRLKGDLDQQRVTVTN